MLPFNLFPDLIAGFCHQHPRAFHNRFAVYFKISRRYVGLHDFSDASLEIVILVDLPGIFQKTVGGFWISSAVIKSPWAS